MQWWHGLKAALRFLLRRRAVEQQIDDEVRSYVAHRADALERRGLERSRAERQSRVECGSVESVKEEIRDVFPAARFSDSWRKDAHFALRMMRKSPGTTAVAVLTLALGIGGTSAVFSVVKAVLLDPLPYADPSRLVILWNELRERGVTRAPGSGFELKEIRARAKSFEAVGGVWASNGTFLGEDEPEQVKVGNVTGNFLPLLGGQPLLGRTLLPEDEGEGKPPVVVLSYGLWRRRFGARPEIIGRVVRMEDANPVVVGVMRPDFRMTFPPDAQVPSEIEAWLPFGHDIYAPGGPYFLRFVGRLSGGVTVAQASEEASAIAAQLRGEFTPFARGGLGLSVVPLHGDAVREARPALLVLFGGIAVVLLIACVNVANLLLARSSARQKEMALRAALGASRGRLFRQLLMESAVLAAVGGAAGIVVGWITLPRLVALAPAGLLPAGTVAMDAGILAFAAVVTLGAGLLFGIAPAFGGSRVNPLAALQSAGHGSAPALRRGSRSALVVSEIALGFVLLVGAGLLIRTFIAVQQVDPGFRAGGLLTFEMDLPWGRYHGDVPRLNRVRQMEEALRALPGVESAGGISHLPLDDYPNWYSTYARAEEADDQQVKRMADHRSATPQYFRAAGAQLVAGRFFDAVDEGAQRPAVVIDEIVAREAWPGQDPLGRKIVSQRLAEGRFIQGAGEVVGVIRHIQHHALTRQVRGQIYIPFSQSVRWHISFLVRTTGDPAALAGAVRGAIAKIDKDLAIAKLRPMTFYLDRAMAASRFTMLLGAVFGGLALLLAAIGIYGVMAYTVNQRNREFGIRMALGAHPGEIQRQVVSEGMRLALAGLALGVAGAVMLGRLLDALLFGVNAADPATYAAAALILPAVALAACWLPARRAARRDPLAVLRAE
ncbi:MAG: ADOP family duplicated permease [Candidatus Acidiferrales bacterium]